MLFENKKASEGAGPLGKFSAYKQRPLGLPQPGSSGGGAGGGLSLA